MNGEVANKQAKLDDDGDGSFEEARQLPEIPSLAEVPAGPRLPGRGAVRRNSRNGRISSGRQPSPAKRTERRFSEEFAMLLGAEAEDDTVLLTVYVPSRDRNGSPLRGRSRAIDRALKLLRSLGSGFTMYKATGEWNGTGGVVSEKTTVAYVQITQNEARLHATEIRRCLHRIGRVGAQDAVGFEVTEQRRIRFIKVFDAA